MTSLSRIEANRTNAQKSTGPKSHQGKARSAQNARKHGLRTKVTSDPTYRAELLALRAELLKTCLDASSPIDALSLAMTEVRRIARTRQDRLQDALAIIEDRGPIDVSALISELETLKRYERRAYYRLYRALEAYAPGKGAPPSRKQHLPKLCSKMRATPPLHSHERLLTEPRSRGPSS